MATRIALAAWAAATAAILACDEGEAMSSDVLGQVDELVAMSDPTRESVAAATGMSLDRDEARSSRHFAVFRGSSGSGAFRSVELRTPASAEASGGTMLVVELDAAECILPDAAHARFGSRHEPAPSPPGAQPPLIYHVMERHGATLRLGFTQGEPTCLRRIVIDRIGRPATRG